MKKKLLCLFILITANKCSVNAQGCSDAGFCTIGSLQSHIPDDSIAGNNNKANLFFSYGKGEQGVNIIQLIPELEFGFLKYNSIQVKIPYVITNGNLGDNNGIGDLAFSVSQKFMANKNSNISVTVGGKFPTGTTNKPSEIYSLPMPYQTGLGTYDLILGISYQAKKWNISTGYQTVLKNENKNTFSYGETFAPVEDAYFESNLLDRGDDALLRVERNFNLKKINFSIGLLGIYRLQKDKITDITGEQIELTGSDGLTLNITGNAQFDFSRHSGINLTFGTPLIVRDVRADGLTRKLVLTLAYNFRF